MILVEEYYLKLFCMGRKIHIVTIKLLIFKYELKVICNITVKIFN